MTGYSGRFKNTTGDLMHRLFVLQGKLGKVEIEQNEIKSEIDEIKSVLERRAGVSNANH